jgi:hypothetical protein
MPDHVTIGGEGEAVKIQIIPTRDELLAAMRAANIPLWAYTGERPSAGN